MFRTAYYIGIEVLSREKGRERERTRKSRHFHAIKKLHFFHWFACKLRKKQSLSYLCVVFMSAWLLRFPLILFSVYFLFRLIQLPFFPSPHYTIRNALLISYLVQYDSGRCIFNVDVDVTHIIIQKPINIMDATRWISRLFNRFRDLAIMKQKKRIKISYNVVVLNSLCETHPYLNRTSNICSFYIFICFLFDINAFHWM